MLFALALACQLVAAAPPASSIRGASVTAHAIANAEVAVSLDGDVYLAVAESAETGVAVWRFSDGELQSLPRLPASPLVGRFHPTSVGTADSVSLMVDGDGRLVAAAVEGNSIRAFQLGTDGWTVVGSWSSPMATGRIESFTVGASDDGMAVAAVQCQDRERNGERWTRVYRIEFVGSDTSVAERVFDWEQSGFCRSTRFHRTIPVGTERLALLTNYAWTEALRVEPGPMTAVEVPADDSVLESPSGRVVAPDYKPESRRDEDRGFVLWGRRQRRGLVRSAAATAGQRLVAVGFMHLGGGHEHTDANRIAVVSELGPDLVTDGLLGVRVPLHSRWELLPGTERPMALFQHEQTVSLVEWRDGVWSSVLASPDVGDRLGTPERLDEAPVLNAHDGTVQLDWWSQGEQGGRMERVEQSAEGWTSPRTVVKERAAWRWKCGAAGVSSLARRMGGGVTLIDSWCGSSWDRWYGATGGSWVKVIADGRRLGRTQRSSTGWLGRTPRRCFGLEIQPFSSDATDSLAPQSETCDPDSAGRVDGQPALLLGLGDESWLFAWDKGWESTRLPDGQWRFSRRGGLLLDYAFREGEMQMDAYRGRRGVDGTVSLERVADTLVLVSDPGLVVVDVDLVDDDTVLAVWTDGEWPDHVLHARLWTEGGWQDLDDGLSDEPSDIRSVAAGPLGRGRPALASSSANDVHFAFLDDDEWVSVSDQLLNPGGTARGDWSGEPTFAGTAEMACFAWSQEDRLGTQIVSECVETQQLVDP